MICLFGRKIFSEKYFLYFSIFSVTKNDGQQKTFSV